MPTIRSVLTKRGFVINEAFFARTLDKPCEGCTHSRGRKLDFLNIDLAHFGMHCNFLQTPENDNLWELAYDLNEFDEEADLLEKAEKLFEYQALESKDELKLLVHESGRSWKDVLEAEIRELIISEEQELKKELYLWALKPTGRKIELPAPRDPEPLVYVQFAGPLGRCPARSLKWLYGQIDERTYLMPELFIHYETSDIGPEMLYQKNLAEPKEPVGTPRVGAIRLESFARKLDSDDGETIEIFKALLQNRGLRQAIEEARNLR